ncbi:lithostathine-1-alpha-like isoform X1 [Embiotoca jacksoni]|uniref:lithostathine-1-alpha-like isoform X1 n=1 Tax=Embiotoca jacksoni TaxID=100190 RepID=UPI003703B6F5
MEKRICVLTLLCLVLSGVGALNVDIPQDRFEFTTGDDITLPCKFTPRIPLKRDGLVIITWSLQTSTADAEETQIIAYYHPSKRSNIRALYEGRVSLDVDIPSGRANLKLNSITLDDNKEFECRLMIPGDDEGKPADITTLVVLEQTKEPSTAATASPTAPCPAVVRDTCPPGWTWFGRRCYLFQNTEKDWADAERFCISLNGNLASIHSRDEHLFLRELIFNAVNGHKPSWVGGYDQVKDGVWLWSDGSVFTFDSWGPGEPNNNNGGEGCMEINLNGQDVVNDEKCSERRSFVCATVNGPLLVPTHTPL